MAWCGMARHAKSQAVPRWGVVEVRGWDSKAKGTGVGGVGGWIGLLDLLLSCVMSKAMLKPLLRKFRVMCWVPRQGVLDGGSKEN